MSSLPRKSYARIPIDIKLPNLIEVQLDSFERLKKEDLAISSMRFRRLNRITRE